jgi:hypothetical protein
MAGRIRKLLPHARDAWLILGVTVLCLLLLEVTLSLAYLAADRVRASSPASLDGRSRSDVYTDVAWTNEYFRELEECSVTQWVPYVYWRRQPYQGQHINVDENGIRRTWGRREDGAGTSEPLRVFTFGGSAMWGVGARDDFTIASCLARNLDEKGIPCEVTNFGESGYVSTQEVIALLQQLRSGNVPDLVIFYDGVNDIYSAYQQQVAGLPQNEFHRVHEFNVSQPSGYRPLRAMFIRRMVSELSMVRLSQNLLRKVGIDVQPTDSATRREAVANPVLDDALLREVLAVYEGNVRAVRVLGEAYGFKALFYWQPTVFGRGCPTPFEQEIQQGIVALQPYCEKMYKLVQQASFSDAHGELFHDMSGVFSHVEQPVFMDWCHISEWGNEQIARKMAANATRLLRAEYTADGSSRSQL